MANRTISLITYATDGTLNTSVTPTVTVSYAGAAASALTPTANGDYYNVTIDDTQDATLLISGTGLTTDHLVFPRIPADRLAEPGDAMTLTVAYDASKTAATQASVNAIPTTPLLAANYTAPDNAGIDAIEAALTSKLDVAVSTRLATSGYTAPPTVDAVADAVWDEVLTGAHHNIATSAGRRLRQLAATIIDDGLAQSAGTNGNQIQLATTASATDGAYDPSIIAIVAGTGFGQARNILEYTGATRVATVDRDWKVLPDTTSEYIIYADAGREHVNEGLAQGGAASAITLNASASSADGAYIGEVVFIRSGVGSDQARRITAYNGTTKVATVDAPWAVIPDTTSAYVMLPTSRLDTAALVDAIDADLTASHGSGTWGAAAPSEWVAITETTLDDSGVALGPMDAADVLIYAITPMGVTVDIARSQGDGGFELNVPPSATYTIRAYRVGYSYDDRQVTV